MRDHLIARISMSCLGVLNTIIPIHFGSLFLIANAVLLLFSLIFDRSKIGLATVVNLTLVGYAAEYSQGLFTNLFPCLPYWGRLTVISISTLVAAFFMGPLISFFHPYCP